MEINNVGAQIPTLPITTPSDVATTGLSNVADQADQLSSGAETAFAAVFFSLLQNVLSEAQNNSSS